MKALRQKLPMSQKTLEWGKQNIDGGISRSYGDLNNRRANKKTQLENYRLYNGEFNPEDFKHVTGSLDTEDAKYEFPAKMEMYPVHIPVFDLLLGEETKRPFNFVAKSTNESALSAKQIQLSDTIQERLNEIITGAFGELDEKQLEEKLGRLDNYAKSEFKTAYEITAQNLVNYFFQDLGLEEEFLKGFEDVLVGSEEIYHVGIKNNKIKAVRENILEIYAILPSNEYKLDNADLIIKESFRTIHEIIDEHYEDLTASQIEDLESDYNDGNHGGGITPDLITPPRSMDSVDTIPDQPFSSYAGYDVEGKIPVRYVTWKSFQKILERTYIDEAGNIQKDVVGEKYIKQPNDISLKVLWINQYWEGTKIGSDIYIKVRPKYSQFRRMDNLSLCSSGYVGTVYNCNNAKAVSLMDRIKPWIKLYMITFYNTELLMASNYGSIALMDMSLIPDGWDPEKWLYYAKAMKIGWVDSFAEKNKGVKKGTQNQSGHNKTLEFKTGDMINQYIQLLAFIESKMKELAGVTEQRLGAISASEQVGNAQRAVNQSALITEKWYYLHNQTKGRVLTTLLEVAKDWVGEDSKKLQYMTSDLNQVLLDLVGTEYSSCDYDVFISNSSKDVAVIDQLQGLMQAAMQNDQITLSDVAKTLGQNNVSEMIQKLEEASKEKQAREQQVAQAGQEGQKEMNDLKREELDIKKQEVELTKYKIDQDNATKIEVAEIGSFKNQMNQDINDNGVPDQLELQKFEAKNQTDNRKLDLESQKLQFDKEKSKEELQIKRQAAKNKPKG
jgi:hypothetical protein